MSITAMGTGPINDRLIKFFNDCRANGKYVSFGSDKNVTAIKKLYVWLQESNKFPDETTRNAKSNKKSKELRLKGNILFSSDTDLSKALDFYNQSICWAEGTSEELAIGYANRSAVYFEWKKFDICIENIDRAVETGSCPERLVEKLLQRKANCFMEMNELVEKDEEISKSNMSSIDNLCLKMSDLRRLKSKYFCFDIDNNCSEPELSLASNPKIPFIVNCLEMKTTPQKGRYIVTTEELKPGQIISIEDPFINSMENEHIYRKCSNCFAENFMNLIPCKYCTCTMFCSQECLTESEKGFHQYECPIAEYIWKNCVEIALTFRLAVKAFTMFDTVEELIGFREENKASNVTAFSFNHTNGLSEKERYSQVDNLCTNQEKRPDEDLVMRGCKVALLYHYMINRTKFGEMLKTERERDTLIEILFQYSQITSVNCFNCYQHDDLELEALSECKSSDVFARGMYPLSSLFNHSCAPNVATITVGTKIVSYVTRIINKNDEVLGCLKRFNHFQRSKKERQYLLKLIYGFACKCEACQNNYPSVHEERLPFGFFNAEIKDTVDAITFNLNEEIDNVDKYIRLLTEHGKDYPTGSLYDIGWKLYRAMALKYGNLASQLQVSMSST